MGVKSVARKENKCEKKKEVRIELRNEEKEDDRAEKNNVVGGSNDGKDNKVGEEDMIKQVNGTRGLVDCSGRRKEKKEKRKKVSVDDVEGNATSDEKRDEDKKKKKLIVEDGSGDVIIEAKSDEGKGKKKKRTESQVGEEDKGLIDCSEDRKEKKKMRSEKKKKESADGVEDWVMIDEKQEVDKKKKLVGKDCSDDAEIEKKRMESEVVQEDTIEQANGVKGKIDWLEDREEKKKKCSEKKKIESSDGAEHNVTANEKWDVVKKKKKPISEDGSDDVGVQVKSDEGNGKKKKKKRTESENVGVGEEDPVQKASDMNDLIDCSEDAKEKKKKKHKEKKKENVDDMEGKATSDQKRDTDKKKRKPISKDGSNDVASETKSDEGKGKKKKKQRTESENVSDGIEEDKMENKKRKRKSEKTTSDDESKQDNEKKKAKKVKKVSFSDDVEVFDDNPSKKKSWKVSNEDGLVQGKRFTPEEDELVRKAVFEYIEEHNLGNEGLDMILNCRKHRELRNCWKQIAEAIPQRPLASVYYRAHILFERADSRKWTDEEREYVRLFYEEHGADWKVLATQLSKHRFHCKDTWRRNKLMNRNKGRWKQEEYQGLFDLVNMDLRMRALEERKSKHGMLRDNICWEAISDRLATRNNSTCCTKWYAQLTSPMVAEGLWADTDDYRLIEALVGLDAPSFAEVDWDNLLEHRDGDVSRKRWNQMVKYIGDYAKLTFCEQVEVLAKRYNPDCVEAREAFDSQPIVDRPDVQAGESDVTK